MLSGESSGVTRVHLPQRWASERELWRYVRDLQVEGIRVVTEVRPTLERGGEGEVTVQQLQLAEPSTTAGRAACVRTVSGLTP